MFPVLFYLQGITQAGGTLFHFFLSLVAELALFDRQTKCRLATVEQLWQSVSFNGNILHARQLDLPHVLVQLDRLTYLKQWLLLVF